MLKQLALPLLVAVALLALLAGCPKEQGTNEGAGAPAAVKGAKAGAPGATAADPKALFEAKCSLCHKLDKPESKHMTKDDWLKTVKQMQGRAEKKHKGWISEQDAAAITSFLAEKYPKK